MSKFISTKWNLSSSGLLKGLTYISVSRMWRCSSWCSAAWEKSDWGELALLAVGKGREVQCFTPNQEFLYARELELAPDCAGDVSSVAGQQGKWWHKQYSKPLQTTAEYWEVCLGIELVFTCNSSFYQLEKREVWKACSYFIPWNRNIEFSHWRLHRNVCTLTTSVLHLEDKSSSFQAG